MRDYFERQFVNPQRAWVIRVSEPEGGVVYENAATKSSENFEVTRFLSAPSFEGVKLELRYRDRSIEQEVRRLALAKTALIGFIDVMLLAGLWLVFANVRRELRLSRMKSDFVANVSHELKTPLALIRLFAETLELGRVPSEEKARQYHRIINKESRRLTQLINNILDFSRIEAGRKEYRFGPGDVGAVVREVIDAYRFPIEQQGFELVVDVPDELPEMPIDPEALSQALINLVNNAIKYSPDEKRIEVARTARRGRRAGVGDGPRDRHPAVGAEEDLREVLPRREQPRAHHQGQRARPRPRAAHHGRARRAGGGGERPGRGEHVRPRPPSPGGGGARARARGDGAGYDDEPAGRRAAGVRPARATRGGGALNRVERRTGRA